MEESALYDSCIAQIKTNAQPMGGPFDTNIGSLLCPSDSNTSNKLGQFRWGRTSYFGSAGDIGTDLTNPWLRRGAFCADQGRFTPGFSNPGQRSVQLKDITDGTSHTLLLGEMVIGDQSNRLPAGVGKNGSNPPWYQPPLICQGLVASGGQTYSAAVTSGYMPGVAGGFLIHPTAFSIPISPQTHRVVPTTTTGTPTCPQVATTQAVSWSLCVTGPRPLSLTPSIMAAHPLRLATQKCSGVRPNGACGAH